VSVFSVNLFPFFESYLCLFVLSVSSDSIYLALDNCVFFETFCKYILARIGLGI